MLQTNLITSSSNVQSGVFSLTFSDVQFDVVDRKGQPWLRAGQLAMALGYKDTRAITKIYQRNSDEFTPSMTEVVNLTPSTNLINETRIFSLRGCHLLAMFARTSVAKEFRVWVLDVLENMNKPHPLPLPQLATKEERRYLDNSPLL